MMWILTKLPFLMRFAPALKLIPAITKYAGLAIVLALWALCWWRGEKIEGLSDDVEAYKASLHECVDANDSNEHTISKLTRANQTLAASLSVSDEQVREMSENLNRQRAENEKRLSGALRELEELKHENPSCEELAAVDIGAVCPAVVERLRKHASGR